MASWVCRLRSPVRFRTECFYFGTSGRLWLSRPQTLGECTAHAYPVGAYIHARPVAVTAIVCYHTLDGRAVNNSRHILCYIMYLGNVLVHVVHVRARYYLVVGGYTSTQIHSTYLGTNVYTRISVEAQQHDELWITAITCSWSRSAFAKRHSDGAGALARPLRTGPFLTCGGPAELGGKQDGRWNGALEAAGGKAAGEAAGEASSKKRY